MAGGADKVRGRVVSVYVGDEFAHQDDQDGVFTAVAPLLQKGAKGIFISTPNGANMFATLYHGRPLGEDFRG
jgi:phage FluMu gp28-like protein